MDNEDEIEWGDDDDFFLINTQPALTNQAARKREEPETSICPDAKEEVEDDCEWGPEEDDDFLVHASQKVEENFKSPAAAGSGGAHPLTTSPPVIESRALTFLNSRKQETESSGNPGWNGTMTNLDDSGVSEKEYKKILAENMAIKEKLYTVLGENSTLRRKMETTTEAKNQEMHERVHKAMEEKKKEADEKREAADEREKMNSELASQKMEVLKMQWRMRHSKNRDQSMHNELSPQQPHSITSMRRPIRNSFMDKGIPPVPKFHASSQSSKQRLLQITGFRFSENDKQLKENEKQDFSLPKPVVLSDYDTDEYRWESSDNSINENCFLNLSDTSISQEERMDVDSSDDSDSTSNSSDGSFLDWEVELAQNPLPPDPPELNLSNVDTVVNWIKQGARDGHSTPQLNELEREEQKRCDIFEQLIDLTTCRAPWVQSFGYIQKTVDHRFESIKTLVADVARLTPRVIGDIEIGSLISDFDIQMEEGRLWQWYLRHIDKKHHESDRQKLRSPSRMPSNCQAGPSVNFLQFVNNSPTETLSAWSLLSHIKVQLEDLIWIDDIKYQWRIYDRNNLEAFIKLIMWVSELWPLVMEEENIPEMVRHHMPHWHVELRSWTSVLLEIGNGDFLFHGVRIL